MLLSSRPVCLVQLTSNMNKLKLSFKKALKIAVLVLVGLNIVGCHSNNPKDSNEKKANPYQSYLDNSEQAISKLNQERKAAREKIITELKANLIYKNLVDSSVVSMEYMPCLNAISNGISYSSNDGFSIDEVLVKQIQTSSNGNNKMEFITKVVALAQNLNGGVPKEIIEIFERYRSKYKLYAEKGINVDANGKQEAISLDYDITPFFGMIDPKNTNILNGIYEAKIKGLSVWSNVKNATYPYLSTKKEYMSYVKQVFPESPYVLKVDAEISASDLYKNYYANEVSADEKFKDKKLAVTGIIGDISKDFTGDAKVSLEIGLLQTINCNFGENTKSISKLSKGDKITIVGTCKGFVVKQVVMEGCEVWE